MTILRKGQILNRQWAWKWDFRRFFDEKGYFLSLDAPEKGHAFFLMVIFLIGVNKFFSRLFSADTSRRPAVQKFRSVKMYASNVETTFCSMF